MEMKYIWCLKLWKGWLCDGLRHLSIFQVSPPLEAVAAPGPNFLVLALNFLVAPPPPLETVASPRADDFDGWGDGGVGGASSCPGLNL